MYGGVGWVVSYHTTRGFAGILPPRGVDMQQVVRTNLGTYPGKLRIVRLPDCLQRLLYTCHVQLRRRDALGPTTREHNVVNSSPARAILDTPGASHV